MDEPDGPLDMAPVHVCDGCGCLVVDAQIHDAVCPGHHPATSPTATPLGPQIVAWLDELDPQQVETASLEHAGFDTNATVAVLEQLKRQAADL